MITAVPVFIFKIQKSNIFTPSFLKFIFDKMIEKNESLSSSVQKRSFATFTDADYKLLEQRFSSFEQAFNWGQRNRYKYKRHSKSFADDLFEKKKYKFYIYGCDCHGADCPNERKFEFQSTGEGTYEIHMFERGLHITSSSIRKKRGIDPRLLDFIDTLCKDIQYAPKDIRYAVIRKAQAGEWGPTEDLIFPSVKQIQYRKQSVRKDNEKYQQFNSALRVQQLTEANLLSSEKQFDSLPVDKVTISVHLNYKSCTTQESQLQPIPTIACGNIPLFKQSSLINPPPSTSDFHWSSSVLSQNSNYKSCTTQESQLQPIPTIACGNIPLFKQSSLINPPPSTSDFHWSSSVLSQNSNYKSCTTQPIPTIACGNIPFSTPPEEPVVPLTSTDTIDSRMSSSSLTTFGDDSSSNLTPQRPKVEHSSINLSADEKYQNYVDKFISIVDTNDYTAEKKLLLTNRVKEMLKCQFGFQFFSDIFNSYSPTERDNMIIQLQMLNCLKKASDKPYLMMEMPIFPETTPSPKRHKRKDFFDYEEYEDGDEITYHD